MRIHRILKVRKVIAILVVAFALLVIGIVITSRWISYGSAELVGIISTYVLFCSAILIYYQIRTNLSFNRRKAATDFIFQEGMQVLIPLERKLLNKLDRSHFGFNQDENIYQNLESMTQEERREFERLVLDILSFYERMAISIFKGSLDEDICYDDRGLILMNIYSWTKEFINDLREEVDPRVFSNLVFLLTARWLPRYEEQNRKIKKVNEWWRSERKRINQLPWRSRRMAEQELETEYRKRLVEAEIVMDKDSS